MASDPPHDTTADLEARLARLEAELAARPPAQSATPARFPPLVERALRYVPMLAIGHLFVGLPAVAVSLGVAYFAFVQAEATDKMQVASVWPRVTYTTSNQTEDGRDRISLSLINKGVGPARIGGLQVSYKGTPYTSFRSILEACCTKDADTMSFGISTINGEVLRPGEEMMFGLVNPEGPPRDVYERFNSERGNLRIETCYCSVFDECWIDSYDRNDPQPVEQCPADWVQYTGFPQSGSIRP